MKKILTILLSVLLLTVSFTACGRQKADLSKVKTLADLEGTTIAAQAGTFHVDAMNQIKNVKPLQFKDFPELLVALNSGMIDGYIAEEPTAYAETLKDENLAYVKFENNKTGFTASELDTGIAVAFKKGNSLRNEVNNIIASVSKEKREQLMKQAVRMSDNKNVSLNEEPVLVSSNTDRSRGKLKVAMECGYDPFNWTQLKGDFNGAVPIHNKNNMYANGYDVQFAKYIANELSMELEVYQNQFDMLIPLVKDGTVDCIIAGMSPTKKRAEEVDFTNCYYNSNLVVIYKKI